MKSLSTIVLVFITIILVDIQSLSAQDKPQKEYVYHCQKLAAIHTDVPVEFDFDQSFHFAEDSSLQFFDTMGFRALVGRYQKLVKNYDQSGAGESSKKSAKKLPNEEQLSLF